MGPKSRNREVANSNPQSSNPPIRKLLLAHDSLDNDRALTPKSKRSKLELRGPRNEVNFAPEAPE
eukprot:15479161-Alexandrium_andersonii.AAC.1